MAHNLDFRAILLKVQDLLSDNDRQRLHFLLGDDVPRHLREDPSINGSLRVLESLLDKAMITEEDCDYLINAFKKINCDNAAQRLQNYQLAQQIDSREPVSLQKILYESSEEDKFNSIGESKRITPQSRIIFQETMKQNQNSIKSSVISSKSEQIDRNLRFILNSIFKITLTPREILLISFVILIVILFSIIINIQLKRKDDSIQYSNQTCYQSCFDTRWIQNGTTVFMFTNNNTQTNSEQFFTHLVIFNEKILLVADSIDNEIIETTDFEHDDTISYSTETIEKLNGPTSVIIDREDENSLIICDRGNKRVVRWSRVTRSYDETLEKDIYCLGLTMGKEGYLYVAENQYNSIRRYREAEENYVVVAGGNGMGNDLHQLNRPSYLFVDKNQSIYISDTNNHRVMKWSPNASHGIIVAGGRGEGNSLTQLSYPTGLFVDSIGTLYISDKGNHRVMRWCNGATQGSIVVGGNGQGNSTNQLNGPDGLTLDLHNNLFVADSINRRIVKFDIEK